MFLTDDLAFVWLIVMLYVKQAGDDKTIKQWKMEAPGYGEEEEPLNTILGKVWSVTIWYSCYRYFLIPPMRLCFHQHLLAS